MARSNRSVTQQIINCLNRYLAGGRTNRKVVIRNTRFEAHGDKCVIKLFNSPIMVIDRNQEDPKRLVSITCSTGDFYDSYDNPSDTTRERLNGLLDYLGDRGYLPRGVRVFIVDGICHIGKDQQTRELDRYSPTVTLMANKNDLVMG